MKKIVFFLVLSSFSYWADAQSFAINKGLLTYARRIAALEKKP